MPKNLLDEVQNELKLSMQKEIGMMREILANMHQEELSLLMQDKAAWDHVMLERSLMVERLSTFRAARISATEKIEHLVLGKAENRNLPLEKLLPVENEGSCEILSLSDQIMALTQRMNFQHSRNENLFDRIKLLGKSPTPLYPQSHIPQPKPQKTSIATYDREKSQ